MTEADIRLFIGCSDNTHPVHVDAQYCKERFKYDSCVVQGILILGVIDGFMAREVVPSEVPVLHYGYEKVRFISPTHPGDTVSADIKVLNTREKNEDFGIVEFEINAVNHRNEIILYAIDKQYIGRKNEQKKSLD